MKGRFLIHWLCFISLLLWLSPVMATSEESPQNPEEAIRTICEQTYCRQPTVIQLRRQDGSVFELEITTPLPIVHENTVSILPGETIYIEAEEGEDGLEHLRAVEAIAHPETTLVFELKQVEELGSGTDMVLTATNPFSQTIKYHLHMMLLDSDALYKTSSCPLAPDIAIYEHWPHPIFQLLLTDFRMLAEDDPAISICEY